MNFQGIKWLNFILTLVALFAIYIFLNDRLDPVPGTILTGVLIIIGLISLAPLLRENKKER